MVGSLQAQLTSDNVVFNLLLLVMNILVFGLNHDKTVAATFLVVVYCALICTMFSYVGLFVISALRFVTNLKPLAHHCALYLRNGWPSLFMPFLSHLYIFCYKDMLDILPSYL